MPFNNAIMCMGSLRLMMLRLGFPDMGFDEALKFAVVYGSEK